MSREIEVLELEREWATHARWARVVRSYRAVDVVRLRGTVQVDPTLARRGAAALWALLHASKAVRAPPVASGNGAVQMARAGAEAIHVPRSVAADVPDARGARAVPPIDPAWSVPSVVRRVHAFLAWAGLLRSAQGGTGGERLPIVADAASGAGGVLEAFESVTQLVEAGAACVRLDDFDLAGGDAAVKALAPPEAVVHRLLAARLAADVLGAPALLVVRTHAPTTHAATRAIAFAPYADVLSFDAARPDLDEARRFARTVHAAVPGKLLAYDLSDSFDGPGRLDPAGVVKLQRELVQLGYRLQLVPPAAVAPAVSTADAALPRRIERLGDLVDLSQHRRAPHGRLRAARPPDEAGGAWLRDVARIVGSYPPAVGPAARPSADDAPRS